jgi:small subunit ribosomal protein S14
MAKTSVTNRNERRKKIVSRLRVKRDKLREAVSNIHLSEAERWEAGQQLQKMPRDSSPSRRRHRCKMCGRPRAYNRLTGLCRLHMRMATINGMVPGMHKASW